MDPRLSTQQNVLDGLSPCWTWELKHVLNPLKIQQLKALLGSISANQPMVNWH